jgi:uncharacterized damage-inducible protein DinB
MSKTKLKSAIIALLDEYKRAIAELVTVIKTLSDKNLAIVVDQQTDDPDCRSIQGVLSHIVRSGYGYTIYMENHMGANIPRPELEALENVNQYIEKLNSMFDYCEKFFQANPDIQIEEFDNSKKINVNWGQQYDVEQLMEHAIVHVLRHRRQIEKFIQLMTK